MSSLRKTCTGLLLVLALLSALHTAIAAPRAMSVQLQWSKLPPVSDREGFAAPFAGVAGGAQVIAGGANFPERKPWDGGAKVWHDSVYVLELSTTVWRLAGKLPRPLAYGLGVTTSNGILCVGGSDAERHYADVFLLEMRNGEVRYQNLPALPTPCANMCGALAGNVLYVAGGTAAPGATNALRLFWSLDLAAERLRWRMLEPWPGPARMLAVAAAHEGAFFLFSGAELHPDAGGNPVRTYLRDAFRYVPGSGWKALPTMPRAAAAAPSPAPFVGSHLLVISGDDGAQVGFEPKSQHPGFPRDMLGYDPRAGTWEALGLSPLSRATVPVVEWQGRFIIPNGEVRPGIRSAEVWSLRPVERAGVKNGKEEREWP